MLCKWNFDPWPGDRKNKRCLGKVGVLELEVPWKCGLGCRWGAQWNGPRPMVEAFAHRPGLDSLSGIAVFPHCVRTELRHPVGCHLLAKAESCWEMTCSLPSSYFGSFQ